MLFLRRTFSTTVRRLDTTAAVSPVKKPIGAFRGATVGFFAGTTLAGGAAYYYIYDEARLASEMLSEDVNALRASIARLDVHVRDLEEKIQEQVVKKK